MWPNTQLVSRLLCIRSDRLSIELHPNLRPSRLARRSVCHSATPAGKSADEIDAFDDPQYLPVGNGFSSGRDIHLSNNRFAGSVGFSGVRKNTPLFVLGSALNSVCSLENSPSESSSLTNPRPSRRPCEYRHRQSPTSRRHSAANRTSSRHRTGRSIRRQATPAAKELRLTRSQCAARYYSNRLLMRRNSYQNLRIA